jgi:hypothetical protein
VIRGLKTEQKLRSSVTATVSLNQLSVVLPAWGGTVSFKYDPFGRRIQKSSSSGTVNYLYDGRSLLEEVDQNWNVLARYYPEQANAWLDARASVRQSVAASADDLSLIPGRSVGPAVGCQVRRLGDAQGAHGDIHPTVTLAVGHFRTCLRTKSRVRPMRTRRFRS